MSGRSADPLQEQLAEAGLEISSKDFLRSFGLALAGRRRAAQGSSSEELSEVEAAAYVAGGFDLKPRKGPSPLDQTLAEFTALIAESRSIVEMSDLLGVDRSRIHQRLKDKSLYGYRRGGQTLIPLYQLEEKTTLPGLEQVLRALDPDAHPLSVYRFFMTPQPDLVIEGPDGMEESVSPRDWLRLEMAPSAVGALAHSLVLI